MKHGLSKYCNEGCRCARCKRAMRDYQREAKKRRMAKRKPAGTHGTVNGYFNYGCRCKRCKAAASEYAKKAYERRKARR